MKAGLALAVGPSLVGCGTPTESSFGDPRLTARPAAPTNTPTIGLSALGLGTSRDGAIYVPASYSVGTPAPLFVALHGAGGSGNNWTSYYDRAEQRGLVLLLPDSRDRTWDLVISGFGADVGFLDLALRRVFQQVRIDPAHIALGGFSDGASYALSLGLPNGDLFSHLVGYSPGFLVDTTPVTGKPPIYISHGVSDPILPVRASRDSIVPRLRDRGYDVTYEEFDGSHEVPSEISEAALDWFLA